MYPVDSHQTSDFSPKLFLEKARASDLLPKAIAIIVALGGIFLLLAAYEIFPSGPNVISYLGESGELLGLALLVIGGLAFTVMYKSSKPKKDPPDLLDKKNIFTTSYPNFNFNSQEDQLSSTFNYTPSSSSQDEDDRNFAKVSKETEDYIRTQDAYMGTINTWPKRVSDGTDLKDTDMTNYNFAISHIERNLKTIEQTLNFKAKNPKNLQNSQNLNPSLFLPVETLISKSITSFIDLYTNGRSIVIPIPSSSDPFAQLVNNRNKFANNINQKIEDVKNTLAQTLAKVYPDINSPPKELENPSCEALSVLAESWKSHINC